MLLDSKTLMLNLSSGTISLWDLDEDVMDANRLTDADVDSIYESLMLYYQRLDVTGNRQAIGELRNNLVDLIWAFAYDEFEDNEAFLTLAKCTEPDLIQSVQGCLSYCLERRCEWSE
jgi:hypothetical protein